MQSPRSGRRFGAIPLGGADIVCHPLVPAMLGVVIEDARGISGGVARRKGVRR